MSDPPKSAPFSFGPPATSGSTTSIFSQPSSGPAANPSSGLFGSNQSATASTNPSIFGSTPSTSGPSLFGGSGAVNKTGSSIFSSSDKTSSGGINFGPTPMNNASSGGFGTGQAASVGNAPSGSSAPSLNFPALSTPNKTSDAAAPNQTQTTSIFGGASSTSSLFGKPGATAVSSSQAETLTPTSKPSTGFNLATSTTPAGPPPNDTTGKGANTSSLFGMNKPPEQKSNIFGPVSTTQPAAAPTFSSFSPSGASGGLFGKSASDAGGSLFNKAGVTSQSGGEIFSNLNKPNNKESTSLPSGKTPSDAPNAGGQSQAAPPKLPATFFTEAGNPTLADGSKITLSNPIFGARPQSTLAGSSAPGLLFSPGSSSAPSNTPSLFGALGAKKDNPEPPGPSTSGASSSLFSNLGKPSNTATSTTNEPGATSAAGAQSTAGAPATKSSLFGALAPPTDPSASIQPKVSAAATNTLNNVGNTNANLSASTTGPPPPAQSRLKNKSMDEIITRWASDLSKYQKEFQRQAEKVASWDRMLVENSDKIQKLYGSTLEAERATTEVERQLTAVENDQAELAIWLDHYEKEVNQMTANQVGQGDSLQGPDQERERTYQLTDRLSDRLQDMGKDLTGMINEINDASSNLSKNNKADDPLSQVVRVLNTHLAQLQEIDQGAAALQAKVAAAQRAGQSMGFSNSLLGPSSDAADGFYRSYMGRR